jgi:alkylresorcinol/alkylpyrone synthase
MNMTKVLATSTLSANYVYTAREIIAHMEKHWFSQMPKDMARKAKLIFDGAEIEQRHSVIPLELVTKNLSFEEKNNLYIENMISLGTKVLAKTLDEHNLKASDLDGIISTSCTGFMIPSVDAHIINRLGMKQHIFRLPVTEMGCAGGTSALIYADQFIRANPGKKVAIVSVETPSITMQLNDYSAENLVSAAIFADGASAIILGDDSEIGPRILDSDMYHFPEATHLMGYNLQNSGLKIVLDKEVPKSIEEHFPKILVPFLERNKLKIQDVEHYLFHPGGKKIINMVEKFIRPYGKDISDSMDVLKKHGNMSSSTIIYILDRFMKKNLNSGKAYMLAFGPGFMAQSLLLDFAE